MASKGRMTTARRAGAAQRELRNVQIRCRTVVLGTLAIELLTGCAEVSQNPKTTIGALGGGALDGLLAGAAGASGTGIAAGVIGGGLLGGLVGNLQDERDRRLAAQALHAPTADSGRRKWKPTDRSNDRLGWGDF
jgi:outer membrane lipoprotein SlyB